MRFKTPVKPEIAAFAVTLYLVIAVNPHFWSLLVKAVAPQTLGDWVFPVAVCVALVTLFTAVLTLVAVRWVFKPVATLFIVLSAAASYYMTEYGVLIDDNLLLNVVHTNAAEVGDVLTGKLILFMGGLGLLPAALLWRTPIAFRPVVEDVRRKTPVVLGTLLLALLAIVPMYKSFASTFREHRELRLSLLPVSGISAVRKYFYRINAVKPENIAKIGEDAYRSVGRAPSAPKTLLVFVLGETTRADHFSLNGYTKNTNPKLAAVPGLVSFTNVMSCGTDTEHSVPCIFSGLGRKGFTLKRARGQEGLLDVLQRAGLRVLWRDNQSGCKGVCKRVATERLNWEKHPVHCASGECHDEILLEGLDEKIAALDRDGVIVLHMMGSHGPAYYKRYPKAFETFTPVCTASLFSRCTDAEIANAFDNTIVYSDHVLAALIAKLKTAEAKGITTAMIYVSDHGESLGENNLYLHGMPYLLSPRAQKHVPMLLWMSERFSSAGGIDRVCVDKRRTDSLSHDYLFHSVLGLMDVETRVYDRKFDLFAACRHQVPGVTAGSGLSSPATVNLKNESAASGP